MRSLRILLVFTLSLTACEFVQAADSWPQFRGPTGQGVVDSDDAPTIWSESENILWKTPLPGRGWSSPVVLGDQIWLTTAMEDLAEFDFKFAKPPADGEEIKPREETLQGQLNLQAVCIDRATGQIVHTVDLFQPEQVKPVHALNSYASPTPVIERGRLYCHFGCYGNACVDTKTGDVLWRRVLPLMHYVGPGSSPVLHGDLLVLTCDGADQQYVTALDKQTGDTVWKTDRPPLRTKNPDFQKSYCTPLVVNVGGRDQLIVTGAQWLVSYDVLTGEEFWRIDHGNGFSVVPRPVANDKTLFCTSGFGGHEVLAIQLGSSDDPNHRGDLTASHIVWREKQQIPTIPSPLLVDSRLYTISDKGVAVCRDADSGELLWKKRIGGNYTASPLLSDGHIYFFNRDGKTTLVEDDGEQANITATHMLDDPILATPAVVDGVMYLRTTTHLYAIGRK